MPPLAIVFAFVALPVIGVDQATKVWAIQALEENGQLQPLLGQWIGLQLIRNPGAAFSLAANHTWVFSIVALAVVVIIACAARKMSSKIWLFSLGLLVGGAIGNLIDRIFQPPGLFKGHVVDFLNYHSMFIGNVADIAIVIGVLLVVILIVLGVPTTHKKRRATHTKSDV